VTSAADVVEKGKLEIVEADKLMGKARKVNKTVAPILHCCKTHHFHFKTSCLHLTKEVNDTKQEFIYIGAPR